MYNDIIWEAKQDDRGTSFHQVAQRERANKQLSKNSRNGAGSVCEYSPINIIQQDIAVHLCLRQYKSITKRTQYNPTNSKLKKHQVHNLTEYLHSFEF
jgi:hypothetical protein